MNVAQAIETLAAHAGDHEFSQSLVNQWRSGRGLSEKQAYWAIKLATEKLTKVPAKSALPDLKGIWEAMPKPSGMLRYTAGKNCPTLQVKKPRQSGRDVLYVTVNDFFFGTVFPDGSFKAGREMAEACHLMPLNKVVDGMVEMIKDPTATSIAYGKITGICAVCGALLTDDTNKGPDGLTSIKRGVGPVCMRRLR